MERITAAPRLVAAIRDRTPDPGELFSTALPRLMEYLATNELGIAGPPLGIYYSVEPEGFDMAVGLPIDRKSEVADESITETELPGGQVAVSNYKGSYDGLQDAWGSFMAEIEAEGLNPHGVCWEEYSVGPESSDDPADWVTRLVQPIN